MKLKTKISVILTLMSSLQVAISATYMNSKVLVPDKYSFYWNFTSTELVGEVRVQTDGWLAFGLTPNGGMSGSDVFVAWQDATSERINFTDRHIRERKVLIDKQQDWKLISGVSVDGLLIIKFERKLKTCDPNEEDINIEAGTQKIIFAWGNSFSATGDITGHEYSNRGSTSLLLVSSLNQQSAFDPNEPITTFDFTVNVIF